MLCIIDGRDVTSLVNAATSSRSKSSCSRTMTINIAQSATDTRIPKIELKTGVPLQFSSDGFNFFGVVSSITVSTESSTADIKAHDMGLYLNRNSVTKKIKGQTPAAAAKALCSRFGIKTGFLESCGGFTFSRNFVSTSLYSAIMTGYTLASEKTGKMYQMVFDGSIMCVVERGSIIGGVVKPRQNLMLSSYSESMERIVNRVDMYDSDGNLVDSVKGDTSYGIMARAITLSDRIDRAYAEKILRDNKLSRTGTIQIYGNSQCVTGNAILVYEPYTGLYGKFYIDADTHTWRNGLYTAKLTLNFENIMDEQTAGSELKKSSEKQQTVQQENDPQRPPMAHYGPHGNLIYEYPAP